MLTSIIYNGGKVVFDYASNPVNSLEKITVYDSGNNVIRTVTLEKTSDASYLNKVSFKDKDTSEIYSYNFAYNGTKTEGHVAIDYWGYYKASSSTTSNALYVPNFEIWESAYNSLRKIPGMDRSPDEFYMKKGMLVQITYPTKGYSSFEYEAHRADGEIYGGLRIKEVKNYDADGTLVERKWYKYGAKEDGNGRAARRVKASDYLYPSTSVEISYNHPEYGSGYIMSFTNYYTYGAFPRCSYFTNGSTVVYPSVTEYSGTSGTPEGKTVYEYTDEQDDPWEGGVRGNVMEIPQYSYSWKNGKLRSKTVTDTNGKVVYSLWNSYELLNSTDYLSLRVNPYGEIDGNGNDDYHNRFSLYPDLSSIFSGSLHDYYHYYITSGSYVVTSSTEMKDGVSRTTTYDYNKRGQVIEESVTDSDGSKLTTRYKYTEELEAAEEGIGLYYAMKSNNIVGPILEKTVYKDDVMIDQVTTEYKQWATNLFAPQYVRQQGYYDPRITYNSYDAYGNPTEVTKDNTESVSYLWGFKGKYPIAELKNGSLNTLLGSDFTDRVTRADSPTLNDWNTINALRSTLKNGQLTVYEYNSKGQVSGITAPNGAKTYYEYDDFSRLSCVKDQGGKILEAYNYDYKQ